jgi:NifU-like protein involved in Fe-S cluster formation
MNKPLGTRLAAIKGGAMSSYELYTERMLNYWEKAQKPIHPSVITHSAEVQSPICGDNVYVEANIKNSILSEIGIFPRGCCVCDACCAIIAEAMVGRTVAELQNFSKDDLRDLVAVVVPNERHYCMSMGLRALQALKPHISRSLI